MGVIIFSYITASLLDPFQNSIPAYIHSAHTAHHSANRNHFECNVVNWKSREISFRIQKPSTQKCIRGVDRFVCVLHRPIPIVIIRFQNFDGRCVLARYGGLVTSETRTKQKKRRRRRTTETKAHASYIGWRPNVQTVSGVRYHAGLVAKSQPLWYRHYDRHYEYSHYDFISSTRTWWNIKCITREYFPQLILTTVAANVCLLW